ncbi:TIGR03905 family TSCPD domain-containing protein [Oleidesulfovibrio sp.]|uniref:TIGR03905 family TSCPD domain-containing protein n=1 Tax=Oleidesulfovibrio sp. TaxID=2909707 RepID=UPI003A8425BF
MYTLTPSGVCAKQIQFDVDAEGRLNNVRFMGGCPGNLEAICRLLDGMDAKDAVGRMQGITCGKKPTSCPDQLAQAVQKVLNGNGESMRSRPGSSAGMTFGLGNPFA